MSSRGAGTGLMKRMAESLMPSRLRRARPQKKWDQKWARRRSFQWQTGGGSTNLARAIEEGWLPPGAEVLDVGCGSGEHAAWLAERGFTVVGIDFSENAIRRARETHGSVPALSFFAADATHPTTLSDRSFGAVIDRGCFHIIPPSLKAAFASNVARWTPAGHTFLLAVSLNKFDDTGWRQHIGDVFSADFEVGDAMPDSEMGEANGVMFRLIRRNNQSG